MLFEVEVIFKHTIADVEADRSDIAVEKAAELAWQLDADETETRITKVSGYHVRDRFLGPNGTVIVTALTSDKVSFQDGGLDADVQTVPRKLFEDSICNGTLHSHHEETVKEKAMFLIDEYCMAEFGSHADFTDLAWIGIGHTTTEDSEQYPIQVYADLENFSIRRYLNKILVETLQYSSLEELIRQELECLSFDDLVYFTDEQIADAVALMGEPESASPMSMDTSGLVVANLPGTWHTADHIELNGQTFWWMTNDVDPHTDPIIVDNDGLLCIRDARNGFDARNVRLLKLESQPVPVMPDETIDKRAMKAYGYYFGGMLPLRKGAAVKLYAENHAIYRLYDDDTDGMVESQDDLDDHAQMNGIFGIEKDDWLDAINKIIVKRSEPNGKEKAHPA